MSYKHFTLEERRYLQELLSKKLSFRKIAQQLGRSPSSISREVRRNRAKYKPRNSDNPYWYNHWRAQNLYIERRRKCVPRALTPCTEEWNYVIDGFRFRWSPEAIAGRWHLLHPDRKPLSASTLYRYVYAGRLPSIKAKTHLRRRGKRQNKGDSSYNTIHPDRIIPEWPEEIQNRTRIGDYEGDTVYGAAGRGYLVTLVDRKSRYLFAKIIRKRTASEARAAMEQMLRNAPVKSISLDNGSEFAEFRELEASLGVPVYFAEPHKPWQRGSNENANGILRFYFPKGFDFLSLSEEELQDVVTSINNRPRKCLGWKTPAEIFLEESVALD